jgi:hypothetical protein
MSLTATLTLPVPLSRTAFSAGCSFDRFATNALPPSHFTRFTHFKRARVHCFHVHEAEYTMKNITMTADEALIEAARERARSENTTLNEQFRLWLAGYARKQRMQQYEQVMSGLRGKLVVGRKLSRDEMNER